MTEQRPDGSSEDLSQTRAFQPIDPYGVGNYADLRPVPEFGGDGGDGADEDDEPYPTIRERIAEFGKARAALVAAAVAIVVGGVAWGTSAALASSDQNPSGVAPPAATGPLTAAQNPNKGVAKAVRVTITSVSPNSFTGILLKGKKVTVVYGDDTKFGNKARPLSPAELAVGMTVTVLGEQAGDTITATSVGMPVKKGGAAAPGTAGTETPGETPAETPSG